MTEKIVRPFVLVKSFYDALVNVYNKNRIPGWVKNNLQSSIMQIITPTKSFPSIFQNNLKNHYEYMMKKAGASITSMPSSETYHALATGVLDTMMTSSASFVSYRLYEVLKYINVPRDYSIWYMAENLIIAQKTWNRLTPEQQKVFLEVAEWMHVNWVYPNFKKLVENLTDA